MIELLYYVDEECIICSQISEDEVLCKGCKSKIKHIKGISSLDIKGEKFYFYSTAYYSYIMMELIIRLKYKSDFACGDMIISFMQRVITDEEISFDLLTFVPSSKAAYKKRGYNQSEYIAIGISKIFDSRVYTLLEKTSITLDQIGLDSSSRWENLSNSFKAKNINKIKNKKVLLVDDVITTGATAFYCKEELMKAGAKEVIVLTAAKSRI